MWAKKNQWKYIPGPTVCISHFSRISVISSSFKLSSGCFTFYMIFSFLAIFHVSQWTFLNFPPFKVLLAIFHVLKFVFLIFRDFQFSHHVLGPTLCISHFSCFSVTSSFFKSSSGCFSFSVIFSFLDIPGPTEWVSHFSRFSVTSSFFKSSSGCFSFSKIFSFLAIFHVLQ